MGTPQVLALSIGYVALLWGGGVVCPLPTGLKVPEWYVDSCHHGWVHLRQMQEVTLLDPRRPGFLPVLVGHGTSDIMTGAWSCLAEAVGQYGAGLGLRDLKLTPYVFS